MVLLLGFTTSKCPAIDLDHHYEGLTRTVYHLPLCLHLIPACQLSAVNCNKSHVPCESIAVLNSLHTYHTHTHTPGDRYDQEPRLRSQHRHADMSKDESYYDEDPRGPIGKSPYTDNGGVSDRTYRDKDFASRPYRDISPTKEEEEEEEEEAKEEKQEQKQ